jgi:hypothetical protein
MNPRNRPSRLPSGEERTANGEKRSITLPGNLVMVAEYLRARAVVRASCNRSTQDIGHKNGAEMRPTEAPSCAYHRVKSYLPTAVPAGAKLSPMSLPPKSISLMLRVEPCESKITWLLVTFLSSDFHAPVAEATSLLPR